LRSPTPVAFGYEPVSYSAVEAGAPRKYRIKEFIYVVMLYETIHDRSCGQNKRGATQTDNI
jgi:hypothetical protein